MSELADRLLSQQTRSERELQALGEGLESKPKPPQSTRKLPRPTPKERVGAGRSLISETTRALIAGLDKRIAAAQAAGNAEKVAEIRARKKQILAEAKK